MEPSDLYGLPLDRFTPERNALAKQLRHSGQREQAGRVAKLRKPSVAAWAVNQLVRTQRQGIEQLFAAGDALRQAQAAVIESRGDAEALREAANAERQAVERLTETARGLLSSQGEELSPAKLQRVSETLHAAALASQAREQVKHGCLERELRHVGLGGLETSLGSGPWAPPARSKPARAKSAQRPSAAPPPSGPSPVEQLREARHREGEVRRRAERSAREVRRAQERREQAAEALHAAEQELVEAHERAAEAEREHRLAQDALKRLKQ